MLHCVYEHCGGSVGGWSLVFIRASIIADIQLSRALDRVLGWLHHILLYLLTTHTHTHTLTAGHCVSSYTKRQTDRQTDTCNYYMTTHSHVDHGCVAVLAACDTNNQLSRHRVELSRSVQRFRTTPDTAA